MKQKHNKLKERPKYTMWQSISFMLKTAWNFNKRVLFVCLFLSVLRILLNLINLFISPMILQKVETSAPISELLFTILFFSGSNFVLSTVFSYVDDTRPLGEMGLRQHIMEQFRFKNCTTSFPNTQNPDMLKLREQGNASMDSNHSATEHIWYTLSTFIKNIAGFCIYLSLLSHTNNFLLMIVMLTSIFQFFATKYINEWEQRHSEERKQYITELNYISSKALSNELAKEIRIFHLSDWLMELYYKSFHLYKAFITKREKVYLIASVLDVIISFFRNALFYFYLLHQVLEQQMTASEFLLYLGAINGFTTWINGILSEFFVLHKECIDISYVLEYLNFAEPFQFENGNDIPSADSFELKLEDVTFCYPQSDKPIFEHLNLTIHAGEKLAIVGLNGAGKTTLIKLLCGFYDPNEGRVLLNGQDIRTFNRKKYYELFSAVFQEFSMPDVTIAEAVSQTATEIDYECVTECLEKAGLTEQIKKFPKGVETHFGRQVYLDGILLSGGQTQRLMLARALYKNGSILVLDEPTAALDPIAENDIYLKYNEMTKEKTSIFISHRLASTRFCDRIIFLANGTIAEEGTHETLLEKNGEYATLFKIQSRYYEDCPIPITEI